MDHSQLETAIRTLYGWEADKLPLLNLYSGPRVTKLIFGSTIDDCTMTFSFATRKIPILIEDSKNGSLASRLPPWSE